jgi:thiamine biosynthesis lipoprotein ApbE
MVVSIIISILLALLVVFLLVKLSQRTREKEQLEKQEKREWMLKVALEQSCQLPTVEAEELVKIEPELNRLMNNAKNDKDVEEIIRQLIMGLYEEKVGKGNKQG